MSNGTWRAVIELGDNQELPFNFELIGGTDSLMITIANAEERIETDRVQVNGDSVKILLPVFEGYIQAAYTANTMQGLFVKESLDKRMPFHAVFGVEERFMTEKEPQFNASGIWETTFSPGTDSSYLAKGVFYQSNGILTGTFRTKTGDYRYLEGIVEGNDLKLSAFDGSHAFLFTAQKKDSILAGMFYSDDHWIEPFVAKRNEAFELPDSNTLTYLKDGYDTFDFSFPDADGNTISLQNEVFQNKVVLVQVMGTWCPNCLDETKFYVDYLNQHPNEDVKVIALAFEYAKTEEKAFEGIKRLQERVGVPYPIALAQFGSRSKVKANEKLPMLNHVLSYPTTIYVDKTGKVRKIHTGFNGPATGQKYQEFKKEFASTIEALRSE